VSAFVPALQAPLPLQVSAPLQTLPSEHDEPLATLFKTQLPEPLQVSGSSHAVSAGLPQPVPLPALVPAVHTPALQVSAPLQTLASAHEDPFVSLFATQLPDPLQESGLSQAVSAGLPQGVPLLALPLL
jgi:hypothetical protein